MSFDSILIYSARRTWGTRIHHKTMKARSIRPRNLSQLSFSLSAGCTWHGERGEGVEASLGQGRGGEEVGNGVRRVARGPPLGAKSKYSWGGAWCAVCRGCVGVVWFAQCHFQICRRTMCRVSGGGRCPPSLVSRIRARATPSTWRAPATLALLHLAIANHL